MKNSIKNLKNYFQLIVTAVTCFMMGIVKERDSETEEAYDGSGNRTGSRVKKVGFLSRIWRTLGMSFVWETPKAKMISDYLVRDKGADKKKEPVSDRERKKDMRKNKKPAYSDQPFRQRSAGPRNPGGFRFSLFQQEPGQEKQYRRCRRPSCQQFCVYRIRHSCT